MSNAKEVRPFGIRDKVGYMFGDLANDFSFIFASTYVMVFYTKVMGISTAMVGTMFLIARCIDAFTDVGMGRIVDSSKPTKNGRIRPWILRMCGFVALAAVQSFFSGMILQNIAQKNRKEFEMDLNMLYRHFGEDSEK